MNDKPVYVLVPIIDEKHQCTGCANVFGMDRSGVRVKEDCTELMNRLGLICSDDGVEGIFVEPTPENLAKSVAWRLTR